MIALSNERIEELLDVAEFQHNMAKQKLSHLETTEGPMADYNLEAYNKKRGELIRAVEFWGDVLGSCKTPVQARTIREDEQRLAMEAVRKRQHYYGPDCIFCGAFGPIDGDEPCFDPDPSKVAEKHQKQIDGLQEIIEKGRKDLSAKACWRDCKCEPRRMETAEARVEVLRQAILLLKHRDVNGEPCFCFLWPDEDPHCEAETGNDACRQVKEALKYPDEGYPMPLMGQFAADNTIKYLEEQARVDGPIFNLGRSEGRADIAVELRKIIDPNDEQHLSLDGTLDIVRKLANLL